MMYVKMKKALCVFFALTVLFLPSCSGKFSKDSDIHTFSYSDGSGLRLSFISSGDFIYINDEGESTNSFTKYTSVEKPADMISAVSSDPAAIGYTLSCYKDESVKEVKIDGTSPTYENVKNDVYPLYCPLYLLYDDTLITDGGLDFIRYILSTDAQQIITKNNFVSISDGTVYDGGQCWEIPVADRGNVRFTVGDAAEVLSHLPEGSVDAIYANFSDPWPKKGYADRRLTSPVFLKEYLRVLRPGGAFRFKTDNDVLFDYSLETIEASPFRMTFCTRDLHHSERAADNIMTEYERNFSEKGVLIKSLEAVKE